MARSEKNIFLFYGDEDYLIDSEVRGMLPHGESAPNVDLIDGEQAELNDIVGSMSSSSLFSSDKFVIIKGLSFLKGVRRGREANEEGEAEEKDSDDVSAIIEALKNVPPATTVIFLVYGSVDKRKKLFKAVEKMGAVREFKPFSEWEQEKLLYWIVEKAKSQGKKIGSHACRLLMEISGSSLRALSLEIEKITTFIGVRETIEESDVQTMASSGGISVFALLEALRKRDIASSLEALNRLIRNKEEPVSLLGLISTQFRMMLQIKAFENLRLSEHEIAVRLNANHFFVGKCAEGADKYSLLELKRSIFTLHQTDMRLKTGYASPQILLELMLIDMLKKVPEHAVKNEARNA